jgi:hypothetical protein
MRTKHTFHSQLKQFKFIILLIGLSLFMAGCLPGSSNGPKHVRANITADNKTQTFEVVVGTSVQAVLQKANITLGNLDRVEPPLTTLISDLVNIKIIRVREQFEIEESPIPFEPQTVHNESLPDGKRMMIQQGINGSKQVTYRRLFENDVEISRTVYKSVVLSEPIPEIIMVGVQSPFTAVPIPGRLVYMTGGNIWLIEGNTGNRQPIVTSGDLDGRIFSLSPDGRWLLFTRKADKDTPDILNTLWVVNLTEKAPQPVSMRVNNVIHFAAWVPGMGITVAYSTVEPRATAPGWQANNDLHLLTISPLGVILKERRLIDANSGGIYGWWGTNFAFSRDGSKLAYARPDSIGLVDLETGSQRPLLSLIPYQTRSEWAWVPGIGWSNDNKVIYTVTHAPKDGLSSNELSPIFNLTAILVDSGQTIDMVPQTGMFAYPVPSPVLPGPQTQIAYLQAAFADKSDNSRYRLTLIDRDGSNRDALFPKEGLPGIEPQQVIWAPGEFEKNKFWLASIYQGNLWLVNPQNSQSQQITGDGTIVKIDWK